MAERIIQLAKNLSELSAKKRDLAFKHGGWSSEKLDGVWVAAICFNGNVLFKSSTLEDYISLQDTELERDIHTRMTGEDNCVLIGEAYKHGVEQNIISGICRTETRGIGTDIELHCHDILTLDEWESMAASRPYAERKVHLERLIQGSTQRLHTIPQFNIANEIQLLEMARAVQRRGGEGVCYRPMDAGWVSGDRSTNLIRDKEKITFDLEALGVSGVKTGPKGGLLGVLNVRWRKFGNPEGEECIQDVRGMTHDDLRAWDADPSLIAGKIVQIEAMKMTPYGTLREPRFKCIREDKTVADL